MKPFIYLIVFLFATLIACAQKQPSYQVYALRYASLAKKNPVSDWVANGPKNDSVEIYFMVWLVKGDQGKNILVDAGCDKDLPSAINFGLTNYTRPDSVVMQLGIKPTDITDIIITHPHWDHLDGIGYFPNAQVWIQKDDYNYFVGQAWQKEQNHGGFVKNDVLQLVERNVDGRVTLVDGDNKEIIPGIKVYTGSRHTFNSQYVGVQSGTDRIIIASDNIWVYYSLEKLLPAPSYGTFDPKGYVNAMKRMKTLASQPDYIIPGHDAKLFSKFPKVNNDIIRIK
ncbi:MAG: N-acyl homoserine lactonase family protein [Bacteroidetes bacterium]|nr:N-acyl homoserine lactonase family protein [Bacteroidota bacterium]